MAAHSDIFRGVRYGTYDNYKGLQKAMEKHIKYDTDEIFFICVGSDRATGDALAPLVGTYLKEKGYNNIYGTIDETVHAQNLDEYIDKLPQDKTIIAIDASLDRIDNIGKLTLNDGELHAGRGVGKQLTPVGDYHITGVVNVSGFMGEQILASTKLSLVMKTAKDITAAIENSFPLKLEEDNKLINKNKKIV